MTYSLSSIREAVYVATLEQIYIRNVLGGDFDAIELDSILAHLIYWR